MNRQWHFVAAFAAFASISNADGATDQSLDEIVVTAGLRTATVAELPQSVTVLDQETLRQAGVQHLEDVLGLIPNLNWASATSRPRYFQLRGIGEIEQYQGAPNPSVGFLIDDIDFSGVGMPATLFDTQQIEVLRGPQGTTYGANALAGLISVRTMDPGSEFDLNGQVTGGTYDTRAASIAVGDGFADGVAGWRLVAQQFTSDGFRHNAYLDRNSTNGFDEGTLRGKLRWQLSGNLRADLIFMHVNIDDGYDAWSPVNSRITTTNEPGRDAQLSNGAALRLVASLGVGELRSVTSRADSKITNSYDGDWGNDVLWGADAPYDYFQADDRRRRTLAEDLRLSGDPSKALFGRIRWLAGVYGLHLSESDRIFYVFDDQFYGAGIGGLDSRYAATNVALYGSLEGDLGRRTSWTAGGRVERREASYSDNADELTPFPRQIDRMFGGNLSLSHAVGDGGHAYVTLARGYKGGGFNIGSQILSEQRSFNPESLWSIETGLKFSHPDNPWEGDADVFYTRRQSMQVYLSQQLQPNNPLAYVFFTQNASNGENFGFEGETRYRITPQWRVSGTGSLLRTRYVGVSGAFAGLGLEGRAQPFAPSYKVSASVEYQHASGWFARLDTTAMGGFYYSTSDSQTSKAYSLENLRLGFRQGRLTSSLWIHNVFNAAYAQNGYTFGLVPPDYPTQSFLDRGDPRQIGLTVDYQWRGSER